MIATHLPDHFLPSAKNESKTIFVVRNPFDVVVSFHKWMTLFENNKNHPWYSDFGDMFEQFLSTTGDSYYFRIKSSICEKIQRHQMGFEQQIWFSIHFLHLVENDLASE